MYRLQERTKQILLESTGLTAQELSNLDFIDEQNYIKQKRGVPVVFCTKRRAHRSARGNPYIASYRIMTEDKVLQREKMMGKDVRHRDGWTKWALS